MVILTSPETQSLKQLAAPVNYVVSARKGDREPCFKERLNQTKGVMDYIPQAESTLFFKSFVPVQERGQHPTLISQPKEIGK